MREFCCFWLSLMLVTGLALGCEDAPAPTATALASTPATFIEQATGSQLRSLALPPRGSWTSTTLVPRAGQRVRVRLELPASQLVAVHLEGLSPEPQNLSGAYDVEWIAGEEPIRLALASTLSEPVMVRWSLSVRG